MAALLLSRAASRTHRARLEGRNELKELIANLVWEDEGHDLHLNSGIDAAYDMGNEIEGFASDDYDLGHDRFRQGSLRFEMLRARE